ncbi:MAG: Ku protein [Desulfohalobiaceae bacterium]|nr:Ku protein [Desulfohalobiaceae bacterium]
MPGRSTALWSGSLTFGLVSIPVMVVPAVRSRRSGFHLIHKKDASRLKREMYCPADKSFVSGEHTLRGYQIEEGRHVIITDEEIASVAPRRSRTIEIQEFVDSASIDAAFYERPYYLAPSGAEKPYRLLVRVIKEMNKAGLAEFVMNARERFCAVQSIDEALCLMILRYPAALRSADDLAPTAEARAGEVRSMQKTVQAMTRGFDPERLRDEYEERIQDLIQRKKQQKETVEVFEAGEKRPGEGPKKEKEEEEEAADLISALEESLAREKERVS